MSDVPLTTPREGVFSNTRSETDDAFAAQDWALFLGVSLMTFVSTAVTLCSSLTGVSDDHKFALIQDLPGPACEDLSFGIIDLVFNTGLNIPYDGGDCKGDVKAGFVRGTKDNALYVKIVRGSKTLRLYKVQTGF